MNDLIFTETYTISWALDIGKVIRLTDRLKAKFTVTLKSAKTLTTTSCRVCIRIRM